MLNKKIISSIGLVSILVTTGFANSEQNIQLKVYKSEPIYNNVISYTPITNCKDVIKEIKVDCEKEDKNTIGLDTIVGTVVGVAVGHQIGGGTGNTIAKVTGGLVGGYAANQINRSNNCTKEIVEKECDTKQIQNNNNVIVGYKNYAKYNDTIIEKDSKDPLEVINVNVSTKITVY